MRPLGPKSDGILGTGSAKHPPNASPMIVPRLKTSGSSKNARLWYFFSFTISAVIVRITPILPLPIPAMVRQNIRAGMLLANPNPRFEMTVAVKPIVIAGLRPHLSAIWAQSMLVANCARAKSATTKPASRDIWAGVLSGGWSERMR